MLAALAAAAMVNWTAPFITIPEAPSRSQAKWIWAMGEAGKSPTQQDGAVGTYAFVKTFRIAAIDPNAEAWFAADNHAEVWLNGVNIGKTNDWSSWTKARVGAILRTGSNEFRVTATNDPGTGINPGGFILKIPGIVSTDKSWTHAPAAESRPVTPAVELGDEAIGPWNLDGPSLIPPIFRKQIELASKPRRATLKVIGLGDYRLHVNGKDVSTDVLLQTWSQYDKTLYWREFDITPYLRKGPNAIAALMGNSFWWVVNPGSNRYFKGDAMPLFGKDKGYLFSAELTLTDATGGRRTITTDETWKWSQGPVTFSHIQSGEDYDARLEPKHWDTPGVLEAGWMSATIAPTPQVSFQEAPRPFVIVKDIFSPKSYRQRPDDTISVDFGQNSSAMIEIVVNGRPGQSVLVRPSEVMTPEGDVQQLNLWGRSAHCVYTLKGAGTETHRWKFWYHGFRYAEIEGVVREGQSNPKGLPVLKSVKALHVRADNPIGGTFETSSDLLNKTHDLIDWAMRSNMTHSMTDCPHREKMGWLECAYLLAPTFSYRYDCKPWLEKIAVDVRDVQEPNGLIGTVAPKYLMLPYESPYMFTVEWGAAGVLLPWHLYTWYGDRASLEKGYESMRGFVDYVVSQSVGHIAPRGLGDWYDYGHGFGPGPSRFTPTDLTSTATHAMCVDAVANAARVLNRPADEQKYRALWNEVRVAFLAKFYDAEKKVTQNTGSPQAGCAIALSANLIPQADREAVLQQIIDDLETRGYQQTPGDVGHVYFVRALSSMGRSDVLHKVYARTGLGSYGGILAKGLTALPETWDAITQGSNSLNHCMLGHAMEWFYGYVLGVRQAPGSVGWKSTVIAPELGNLTRAKGNVTTPRGVFRVSWKRAGDQLSMDVAVPNGASAEVIAPRGFRFAATKRDTVTVKGGRSRLTALKG